MFTFNAIMLKNKTLPLRRILSGVRIYKFSFSIFGGGGTPHTKLDKEFERPTRAPAMKRRQPVG